MKEKREAPMSPSLMIAIGFALLILLVTLLLMLPIASQSRTVTPPLTALFTATSAVCVTGQVLVDTGTHWSLFGQVVLIAAIQIGGLGVMTLLALVSMAMGRRIGLRQRTILQESVASFSVGGIVRLIRLALIGTAVIEGLGAAALAFRFVPMLGWAKGLWYSVFHAISAFCNAGFDLMGPVSGSFSSLERFAGDPLINLTVMTLILVAGLGFPVWQDLTKNRLCWKKLRLHTRVVLALTAFLVLVPAALFFITEKNAAMAGMPTGTRVWASLFSAVTPRTAGFDTVPTGELSPAGGMLTLLLMLTGGNSGSTAGGVKTVTVGVILLAAWSTARGRTSVQIMKRRIPQQAVANASALFILVLLLSGLGAAFLSIADHVSLENALYETISALCTVGLTTGITSTLCAASQIVLIIFMFFGRLGIMTISVGFLAADRAEERVSYAETKIMIG